MSCSAVWCGKVKNCQLQQQQKYYSKAFENEKENYIKETKYIYIHIHKFFQNSHAVDTVVVKVSINDITL
jgi:hypothetical protein